ncbi:hypothetical protein PRIC1_002083 [Phytophthora ramorum]
MHGSAIADVMLFDEAVEDLGEAHAPEPASAAERALGRTARVLFFSTFGTEAQRQARQAHGERDLKITKMEPLLPRLLPEPAATLAINLLQQRSGGNHLAS